MVRSILLSLLLAATLSSTAYAEPASQPARQPTGKWYCWSACVKSSICAVTPRDLWFTEYKGLIWRYDLKTREIEAFSPLEGLPLEVHELKRVATSAKGDCAILLGHWYRVFLWQPGRSWQMLPPIPGRNDLEGVAFDEHGRLLCLVAHGNHCAVYLWKDKKWKHLGDTPPCNAIIPIKGGYVLTGGKGPGFFATESSDFHEYRSARFDQFNPRYFRMGGRTYALLNRRLQTNTNHCGWSRIGELVPKEPVSRLNAQFVGLDFLKKGFISAEFAGEANGNFCYRIIGLKNVVAKVKKTHGYYIAPFRDTNGHVWIGTSRWDGKEWRQVLPKYAVDFSYNKVIFLKHNEVVLDGESMTWRRIGHNRPESTTGYDAKSDTWWRATPCGGSFKLEWVQHKENKTVVLRRIDSLKYTGTPLFKTQDGNWWWLGYRTPIGKKLEYFAIRLTKDGINTYPVVSEGTVPNIRLSPSGNIWVWAGQHRCLRYNAELDVFVKTDPLEDFAFKFSRWKLSLQLGPFEESVLYRKVDGRWKPFAVPFGPEKVWGLPNMIRGDRMLVACEGVGTLEYDATNQRWMLLHNSTFSAGFDKQGRRILVNYRNILSFDDDPFESPTEKNDLTLYRSLLKQMNNDRWATRQKATGEMKKIARGLCWRLKTDASDPSLSLEVRLRLEQILKEIGNGGKPLSLFHRMHPPLKPVK